MPYSMLLAAVDVAAAQVDCISSLALSMIELLDQAPARADPLETARRAADLARITFDQLRLVADGLTITEENAEACFAAEAASAAA